MSLDHPKFDTLQAHAGQSPDPVTGARAVPIYQTSSYVFESVEAAGEIFALKQEGNIYTRLMNPTTDVLEKRIAALENGVGALAYSSGMAAISHAIFALASAGDNIVSATTLYGGTHTLFSHRFPEQFGIGCKLVDPDDLAAIEAAIDDKTKAVYFETIGNPNSNIPDIEAIAQIAHKHGIPVVCDNTFGTPYLITLKDWGVDIVVHSLTKYIGGHGTSLGGIIVDLGTFDWKGNPRFPGFNAPDKTYHDIVFADMPGGYIARARAHGIRDIGACISPMNAFLILLGVETLSLRVERHCRNAEKIADFLAAHPAVSWVKYPYLPGDPYHERMQKYLPKGVGSVFTFGINGGLEAGKRFIDSLRLFSHLANVADAKSLIIHPASTTHGQLSKEELAEAGVPEDMIRISVGIEDVGDLMEDLEQALSRAIKE